VPYLVDTNVAIEHLHGNPRVVQVLDQLLGRTVFLSWATVAELFEGAFATSNSEANIVEIRHAFATFDVLAPTNAIALRFAELRTYLRRRGQLIDNFDLIIAATALDTDLTLVTLNRRHFERIPELRLYTFR
jgi:tRNA(fMet)-specific endonuclease VapC